MSQLTHPTPALPQHVRSHRAAWLGAILVMTAIAAVVLILALGDAGSSQDVVPASSQVGVRADGGPEETGVAAAIGSRPVSRPDESTVAAAIGSPPDSRPDESAVASAITRR